jgi:rod shape-determining protein MreC
MSGRRDAFGFRNARSSGRHGAALFALYFVATALLALSRIGHEKIDEARSALADWSVPALEILSMPATEIRHGVERARTTIDLLDEVARLRAENQRLKSWEWRAKMLDQRMRQMQRLLNVVDEPALEFVSGRVIADGRGPFMRSVLINVGRPQGVRSGYAVIGADGLLGRVLSSGDAASRVLLLNDLKSRIPVFVGETRIRALLVGDNSAWPRLEFLPEGADVRTGDDVYTSGHDGLLPRGLRVGAVFGAKGALRVRTSADLSRFEQVSVLFFDASSRLAVKGSDGDETAASAGSDRLPRPVVSATP